MSESERPVPEAPTPPVYRETPDQRIQLKRSVTDYLFPGQIAYDEWLPRLPFLERFFKTQKGTLKHGEKRGLTRRQFVLWIVNGSTALGYAYGAGLIGKSLIVDRLMNPSASEEGAAIENEETVLLYLLDGANSDPRSDGVNVLARDLAIASLGVNVDNQQPVNFLDRSTWGHSELNVYFRAMDQFFIDIPTTSGRQNLRRLLGKSGGGSLSTRLNHISQFEAFLHNNRLPDNASLYDLQTYFTTPREAQGLGYTLDQWNLIQDSLHAYRNSALTPALKERINKVNERSGTAFRIP